ncbi:MAG TPA: hypothetical protein VK941_11890, partial [Gillisia sp.]|nr:hypothetical protein [Gillisia sp.]
GSYFSHESTNVFGFPALHTTVILNLFQDLMDLDVANLKNPSLASHPFTRLPSLLSSLFSLFSFLDSWFLFLFR